VKKAIFSISLIIIILLSVSCGKKGGENASQAEASQTTAEVRIKHTDDIPLINAVNNKNYNEVKKLLEKGANPNSKNKYGVSTLILASYNGSFVIVKLLLEAGADVNAKDRDGDTALHNGVYKKHERVVTTLLNHDADINIKNSKGKTPLDIALEIKNTTTDAADIYALLASVNINISPLIEAVRKNNPSLVSKLLKEGADPNQAINKFEFYFGGYKKILKLPALYYAKEKGDTKIIAILKNAGAR
jgi:ankyrin repeat protein